MTAALVLAGTASADVPGPPYVASRRMGEVGRPVQPARLSDGIRPRRGRSARHHRAGRRGVDRSADAVAGRRHSRHARTIHVPLAVRGTRRTRQDQLEPRAVAAGGLRRRDGGARTAIPAAQKNRSSARGAAATKWPRVVDHTLLKPEATPTRCDGVGGARPPSSGCTRCACHRRWSRVAKSSAPAGLHIAVRRGISRQANIFRRSRPPRPRRRSPRAPTRSTWSSTSAPPCPVNSTRCGPMSPPSAPPCPTRSSR